MSNSSEIRVILVALLIQTVVACVPTADSLLTTKASFILSVTPTPLPEGAEIADINFRKDRQAEYGSTKAELEKRRDRWRSSQLSNYDFEIAKYIGGVSSPWNRSPVIIKVREGIPTSLQVIDNSDVSRKARTDGFEEFDTIPKFFDYLLSELEKGNIVNVEYDRRLSYPVKAFVTFTYQRNHNVRSIVISRMLPLEKEK